MRKPVTQAAVLAASMLLLGQAFAETVTTSTTTLPADTSGRLYGSIATGVVNFKAPEREGMGLVYEEDDNVQVNNIYDFEPEDEANSIALTLGRTISDVNWFPGMNHRIQGTITYYEAEDQQTLSRDNGITGYYTDYMAIDGRGYIEDVANGEVIRSKYEADFQYVDLNVRMIADLPLEDTSLLLSPYIGVSAVQIEEAYKTEFTATGSNVDFNHIDEDVTTYYIGALIGSTLTYKINPKFSVAIDGSVMLAYVSSEYDADQAFVSQLGGASVNDSQKDFSYRSSLVLSASYDLDWSVISLEAGVDYWDYAALIEHPTAPLGESYSSVANTGAAKLDKDTMTNTFVGLRLSHSF